jgi:hypothetical protein
LQALQDPTPENIGLILAAEWDPDCVPMPWVPSLCAHANHWPKPQQHHNNRWRDDH